MKKLQVEMDDATSNPVQQVREKFPDTYDVNTDSKDDWLTF